MKTKRAPLTFDAKPVTPVPAEETQTALPANTKTPKREKEQTRSVRDGRQFIAAHVPPAAAKQFKLLAVQADRTTQDLLSEAINDLFAKHGLSRIA